MRAYNWSEYQFTRQGAELHAKVEAGQCKLKLTKMKIGEGNVKASELETMTDLKSPQLIVGISSCTVSEEDSKVCKVVGIAASGNVENSFLVTELGLYATDPEVGEILYLVCLDSAPERMPNKRAASPVTLTYQFDVVTSNTANVTAVITPTGLATAKMIEDHRKVEEIDHPDESVTTPKIRDGAVTSVKIAERAIEKKHLRKGGIVAGDIGAYSKEDVNKLLADHRTKTPLDHPDGSVTTAKLADGSVTTAKLADKSVTAKQLAVSAGELGAYTKAETDARLNTKAALVSPALTGTPTAPTAGRGTNNAQVATTAFVTQAIAALINGSPGALDTLQELAKALGNDADFAATVTNALAGKVAKSGDTMTGRLTAPSVLVNDWFRALGDCGFYFENHGGGWHMTDDEWIRAFNGKNIYTSGKMRCDAGFEGSLRGTADNANKLGDKSLQWVLEQIKAANTGVVASNLQQNGWIKFVNGIILQWGSWGESVQEKSQWFVFPLAFPSRCFKAIVGTSLLQEHVNADMGYQVIALERTRAKIMTQHFSAHISGVLGQIKAAPEFIAIGI